MGVERGNYKSDYDVTAEMYSSGKTDGYNHEHNALFNDTGDYHDRHEHIFYDPATGTCGWHGIDYDTRHNHD